MIRRGAVSLLKMLIVEDERIEREGLLNFLKWEDFGLEVAGAACDGTEGIEMAERTRPDIIITDIKMPGIDGLGMSKKIKEFLPDVKIIILTGYDDFNMAREAISFHVNAYILKPLEEEEMIPVLRKVVGECLAEKERAENERSVKILLEKNLDLAKRKFLTDLLKGNTGVGDLTGRLAEYGVKTAASGRYCAAIADISDGNGQYPLSPIEELIDRLLEDILVFRVAEGLKPQIALCLSVPTDGIVPAERIRAFSDAVLEKHGIRTVIGVGGYAASLYDMEESYRQAEQAVEHGIFRSVSGCLEYEKIDGLRVEFAGYTDDFLISFSYYTKQIVNAVRSCDAVRLSGLLEGLFRFIRSDGGAGRDLVANCLQNMLNEASIILFAKNVSPDCAGRLTRLQSLKLMEESTLDFFREAFEVINGKKCSKDADIIKKVVCLIEEKYMSDISLKLMAGEVYLSPNYLGNIFRKHTGVTFNEYLSDYRMEKARELLASPKSKVSWVAEKVGIPNTSYFCTLFKSKYGVAPGEYQETILRK